MESFLIYIAKVAIAAGVFYLGFLVLFQNQKHFRFNRIYLPVTMLVSFMIPLISFTSVQYIEPPTFDLNSLAYLENSNADILQSRFVLEWYHYLTGIYLLGIAGFLTHLLTGNLKAFYIVRKSRIQELFESWINITKKDVHPFSFFNKIVLSEKTLSNENLQMIVFHEKIHVKEKHTLDILFTEIMFLLQWFNPFAWLLKDAVKNNLEYKTDHQVVQKFNPQKYQLAMLSMADKEGIAPFLTALNGSQLKSRIIMMKKKTENKFSFVKQLVVLPLLAVLVMGLSTKEVKTEYLNQPVEENIPSKKLVVIVDGKEIPSDSKNLKNLDFSHGFNGGEIVDALGISDEKITLSHMVIGEENENIQLLIRTTDYIPGSNPEFDKLTGEANIGKPVAKSSKTLYAIDGQIKTEEEIGNLDNYSFESLVVLDGKSATDKYGDAANNASVMDFKTGEKIVKFSSVEKTGIPQKDSVKNGKRADIEVIGYGQEAGNKAQIRIRSTGSANGEGKPLIIVDGKEVEKPEDINPDSIESMTVLKGETATAIYGEKAKDGVILITLKKAGESTSEIIKEGIKINGYGQNKEENTQIRIRGTSSVSGEGKPLVIVDGKEVKDLDSIDPNSIESMTVLKDKSATNIYGEKAKDGAILITMKKPGESTSNNIKEGVKVIGYGRDAGNNAQIRIRSIEGTNGEGKPLYIVDGIAVENADNISPENIESISVLKNEAATVLYGEKAKDGAIVITTKKDENKVSEKTFEGVEIISYGKETDQDPKVLIRGISSISGDKKPLIVVDGKKYKSMEKANITPEKIDNITVLKGESATKLYGKKAKDGAIIIETKKKSENK